MNLFDCLKKLDEEEVKNIGVEWECCPSDGKLDKSTYIKMIHEHFILKDFFKKEFLRYSKDSLIQEIDRELLKHSILGIDIDNIKPKEKLNKLGIMYGTIIPNEFQKTILEILRNESLEIVDDVSLEVRYSPFLKIILILNYLSKGTYKETEMFKCINLEGDKFNKNHIINYLKIRKLIEKQEEYILVNKEKLKEWINQGNNSISDFYNYVFKILNIDSIRDVLNKIYGIYENSEQWLDLNAINVIKNKFKNEIDTAEELGMIFLFKSSYNKEYIKLSSEIWHLISSEKPWQWEQKEILITPFSQVFVPYNFDPFVLQIIDYFGEIKKDKKGKVVQYNSDYFIIADISKSKEVEVNIFHYNQLIKLLQDYIENIPDTVKYQLF